LSAAHGALGAAYYRIPGQEKRAIHHYRQALAAEEDAGAYRFLGELYFGQGRFSQALTMFEQVLRVDVTYPGIADVYNAIGVCLAKLERYEDALPYLERAREEQANLTIKPSEIYNNLGVCYWHLGRHDEAAAAFKTALSLMHPKDKGYRQIEAYLRAVQAGACLGNSRTP
jgi:tetratricopeptide (TPR) repeat protein